MKLCIQCRSAWVVIVAACATAAVAAVCQFTRADTPNTPGPDGVVGDVGKLKGAVADLESRMLRIVSKDDAIVLADSKSSTWKTVPRVNEPATRETTVDVSFGITFKEKPNVVVGISRFHGTPGLIHARVLPEHIDLDKCKITFVSHKDATISTIGVNWIAYGR